MTSTPAPVGDSDAGFRLSQRILRFNDLPHLPRKIFFDNFLKVLNSCRGVYLLVLGKGPILTIQRDSIFNKAILPQQPQIPFPVQDEIDHLCISTGGIVRA